MIVLFLNNSQFIQKSPKLLPELLPFIQPALLFCSKDTHNFLSGSCIFTSQFFQLYHLSLSSFKFIEKLTLSFTGSFSLDLPHKQPQQLGTSLKHFIAYFGPSFTFKFWF
ncbi:hypothetical protein ACB098_04G054700 [Castanea mollissima]